MKSGDLHGWAQVALSEWVVRLSAYAFTHNNRQHKYNAIEMLHALVQFRRNLRKRKKQHGRRKARSA